VKWSGRLFQMSGATTLKLRLPSSVAVLGTARFPRSENRDRLGQRDSPSVRRGAGNMQDRHSGTSDTVECTKANLNCIR